MRARDRLTSTFVRSAPPGRHCDGAGLYLHVRPDGGAQWFLRLMVQGRRRDMGLGGLSDVGLAEVRREAERWRAEARAGRDPIKVRDKERREARREDIALAVITSDAFEARKAELKGDGKAGRWLSPLEVHVLPRLGKVPVTDIDQRDLRDVLAPIWHTKADVARKALNRLSIVLRHAAALGLDVDLQATEKAKALLGKSRHVAKNIPAMSWAEVPAFYKTLTEPTPVQLAMRLLILTGVRSAPLRHIRLDQIETLVWYETDKDSREKIRREVMAWTIPASMMKGRKDKTADFAVPLSREALAVIEAARPFARDGFLFPGARKGVVSDMALGRFMERRGLEARPHGFRTSLRVWLAEATGASHEVAETCLAHVTGNAASRSYNRTDYLGQRAALMERWADYVTGGTGAVVKLAAGA